MILKIEKKVTKEFLEILIETKIKDYYSHKNEILTDQEVLKLAKEEHDIECLISRPEHNVGNYRNSSTNNVGTWVYKLKQKPKPKRKPRQKTIKQETEEPTNTSAEKKPLTKTSLRSKINKIAKELKENED